MDLVVNINNTDVVITSSPLMENSGSNGLLGMLDILLSRGADGSYKAFFYGYASLVTMELELNQQKTYFDPVFKHAVDDGWYTYARIPVYQDSSPLYEPFISHDQSKDQYYFIDPQHSSHVMINNGFTELFTDPQMSSILKGENTGTIEFFAYGALNECVMNMQRKYILSNPCNKIMCDDDNKSHRDYLFIAVNVVHWLASKGEYAEAERILEALQGCKGICNNNNKINNYSCNCN